MRPYFRFRFGNPGSLHRFGQEAIAAVDGAREAISASIGARFRELIFTGSATEANNIVLRGIVRAWKRKYERTPKLLVSAIEHESILETAEDLVKDGVEVIRIPVNKEGIVDLAALEKLLDEDISLVSIMYGNNETGAIEPVQKIGELIRKARAAYASLYPLFHSDASQAFQFLDCNVERLGVDCMTFSGHKIYGPKGVGALFVRENTPIDPVLTGGGQEFSLRSGTENVPLIAGLGKAVGLILESRSREAERIRVLTRLLWKGIGQLCPGSKVNGPSIGSKESLPHILNVYFPGKNAQELLTHLDLLGLAVSAGSACSSRAAEPSYVIRAMGFSEARARSSIRLSLGKYIKKSDVDRALRVITIVLRSVTK